MLDSNYLNRFAGIARLYGQPALERFQRSHVIVTGIGGVGSWIAESLVRSGIGKITLIDMDDVCVSNINRQIHALASTLGQPKIIVMAERLKQINPMVKVLEIDDFINTDNLSEYLDISADYMVDAIDSVISKAATIAYCRRNKIPMITIGAAGGKIDPSRITLKDLTQTVNDPLLAKIRNELRRKHNFSRNVKQKFGIDAVFSTEQVIYPGEDGTVCLARPKQMSPGKLDCSGGIGAASFVTGGFAFLAVSRILQKLSAQ